MLGGAVEEAVDARGKDHGADRDRPPESEEHLVEAPGRVGESIPRLGVEDREHRESDVEDRDRDEKEGLDRLVGKGVEARLGESPEVVEDRLVDLEIEGGDHEGEGEGQAFPEPGAEKAEVELPLPADHPPDRDHGSEVDAAEAIAGGVDPEKERDTPVSGHAVAGPGEEDQRLGQDRIGLVAEPAEGVEGAPEHIGIGVQEHHREGRQQERLKAGDPHHRRQDGESGEGEDGPCAEDAVEVVRDPVGSPRSLPCVKGVEAEVDQDRDQSRVGDDELELSVARLAERVGGGEDGDQGDAARRDAGDQQHRRVADRPGSDRLLGALRAAACLAGHQATNRVPEKVAARPEASPTRTVATVKGPAPSFSSLLCPA